MLRQQLVHDEMAVLPDRVVELRGECGPDVYRGNGLAITRWSAR